MLTTISILSFLAMLAGVVLLILRKIKIDKDRHNEPKPIYAGSAWPPLIGLIAGVFLFAATSCLTIIGAQDVGVVVSPSGVQEEELHTGWHFVWPWYEVKVMDKTVWVYTFTTKQGEGTKHDDDAIWVPTKDGIKMGFDLSVSWRVDPDYASWIYANVSENDGGKTGRYLWLEENVIRAKTKSALASAVLNFTPIEAYSDKRTEIRNISFKILSDELKTYHLILDQIDMREVFYNKEYENAINQKKLAEQEVLRLVEVTRQKNEQLKQAVIDKDIAIQQAEGEAKALQIKGSSVASNPKIIQLEWVAKWNGVLPTYMMGDGQSLILNMPASGDKK